MDLREFGEVHDFVDARLKQEGGGDRSSKTAAFKAAAKKFDIDRKTARLHYERVRRSMTPEAVRYLVWKEPGGFEEALLGRELQEMGAEAGIALVRRAFAPDEIRQLERIAVPLLLKLARERLELIELRKQPKRTKRT